MKSVNCVPWSWAVGVQHSGSQRPQEDLPNHEIIINIDFELRLYINFDTFS